MNVFDWMTDVKTYGWHRIAYREFRSLLQPSVKFSRPIRWPDLDRASEGPPHEPRIKDFVDWEVTLSSGDDIRYELDRLRAMEGWDDLLTTLLPDLTSLLKDAFDLMSELEGASEQHDLSYINHPSISDHSQNRHFEEWSVLVVLCRDAWIITAGRNVEAAKAELNRWRTIKHPIFRRLCFFAAQCSDSAVSSEAALELLSEGSAWWLWSVETQRESMQLIGALAQRLNTKDADRLTELILRGPPREMYKAELDDSHWDRVRRRTIWLRLAKFKINGGHLGGRAQATFDAIGGAQPEFVLDPDERDEFPSYVSTGGASEWRRQVTLPDTRPELASAIQDRPSDDFFYEDNWRHLLANNFRVAVGALLQLAQEHKWPQSAWQDALQYLSDEKIVRRAWYRLHKALEAAPVETITSLLPTLSWWIKSAANTLPLQTAPAFFRLLDVAQGVETKEADSPPLTLSKAINHPVGHLTEALVRWWYRTGPKVGGLLPPEIGRRLTSLLTTDATKGAARVVLAGHLANLFIVDRSWTSEMLLPDFHWQKDAIIAHHMWESYLGNPNISAELISGFKADFIETAKHYEELGQYGKQYAGLLAITLLELREAFSPHEARTLLQTMGADGIAEAAHRVAAALANAGDRREEYWTNRVKPLLEEVWPKSAKYRSSEESCALAEICIRSGQLVEDAMRIVMPWLRPAASCRLIAMHLADSNIPKTSPTAALKLLAAIVDTNEQFSPSKLAIVLEAVGVASPALRETEEFRRLLNHAQQFSFD